MIDERTELLINRRLDGELGEDEALELNKRLIRSPEARRLLEEYSRIEGPPPKQNSGFWSRLKEALGRAHEDRDGLQPASAKALGYKRGPSSSNR